MHGTTLTDGEVRAWLPFAVVLELLPAALNAQLTRDHNLTLFEFYVLNWLRGAPDHRMRLSALAAGTSSTVPRISKVTSRLAAAGLVRRVTGHATDGRAVTIELTPAGERALVAAEPGHLHAVRELVIDVLSPAQVGQLEAISEVLATRLHPHSDHPLDRQPTPGAESAQRAAALRDTLDSVAAHIPRRTPPQPQ